MNIEIVLKYMSLEPESVWKNLVIPNSHRFEAHSLCKLYGVECTVRDLPKELMRLGKPHFVVEVDHGEIQYVPIANFKLNLLVIKFDDLGRSEVYQLIKPFATNEAFISTRDYDSEYEYLQNTENPDTYRCAGHDISKMPMKSNGLPPPLDKLIIDTSNNPGRRILREGFIEAVGSVMWLGKDFWSLTGACKRKVLTADWLQCEHLPNDVLRIQAADEPFKTAEGEQGEIQDRLRKLLFPNTAVSRP